MAPCTESTTLHHFNELNELLYGTSWDFLGRCTGLICHEVADIFLPKLDRNFSDFRCINSVLHINVNLSEFSLSKVIANITRGDLHEFIVDEYFVGRVGVGVERAVAMVEVLHHHWK
jgi:hypothetical protein